MRMQSQRGGVNDFFVFTTFSILFFLFSLLMKIYTAYRSLGGSMMKIAMDFSYGEGQGPHEYFLAFCEPQNLSEA